MCLLCLGLTVPHSHQHSSKTPIFQDLSTDVDAPVADPIFSASGAGARGITFRQTALFSAADTYGGTSFGMAVIDIDDDGRDELYVNVHGRRVNFFLDDTGEITAMESGWAADDHGISVADFDADGDWDFAEATGGGLGVSGYDVTFSDHLFVNDGSGEFQNMAFALGVDNDATRSRNVNWFDFNKDGRLDLFIGAAPAPDGSNPASLFLQQANGRFSEAPRSLISFPDASHGLSYGDFDGDGALDIVFNPVNHQRSVAVRSWSGSGWTDTTEKILGNIKIGGGNDIVIADFNGDGADDMYIARQTKLTDLVKIDDDAWRAAITTNRSDRVSQTQFKVAEGWTLDFRGDTNLDLSKISLNGKAVDSKMISSASISSSSPTVSGDTDVEITVSGDNLTIRTDSVQRRFYVVDGVSELVSKKLPQDFTRSEPDTLLLSDGQGQLRDAALPYLNGFGTVSAGVGDFDNDGDNDLYLVRGSLAQNVRDVVLENDGSGHFTALRLGGATRGIAQGVVVFDRDNDGSLDLAIADGAGNPYFNEGPGYRLFSANAPAQNHWLQLDLRDGIGLSPYGAQVSVNDQRKVFSSGAHGPNGNDTTLHFGLAQTALVDGTVTWQDGKIDRFEVPWAVDRKYILHKSADHVVGTARDDILIGDRFTDRLIGGNGNDVLDGKLHADIMIGGSGNDIYFQNVRRDKVIEQASGGWDIVYTKSHITDGSLHVEKTVLVGAAYGYEGHWAVDFVAGNESRNLLRTFAGDDRLLGRGGHDVLNGGKGHDLISGNFGNDVLFGGAGDDRLIGGYGADKLFGGAGADTFLFRNRFDTTTAKHDQVFLDGDDQIDLSALDISRSDLRFDLGADGKSGVLYAPLDAISVDFELDILWTGTASGFSRDVVFDSLIF